MHVAVYSDMTLENMTFWWCQIAEQD